METIGVELGERRYDIVIEAGGLARAGALIAPHLRGGAALVVSDRTVADLHARPLLASLAAAGVAARLAVIEPGEERKSLESADQLWRECAAARLDRHAAIIALGGGVIGDLAGFIAATWMRGIGFVQIPTTLLAMVDSSVGGKTGINTAAGKNLVGAFIQPRSVLIDPCLLATLPPREYRSGLAEVLKYGVIRDPAFLAWQETNAAALAACDPHAVAQAVARSVAIKAWYVVEDEFENGVRAHLNYGHTFGHALEKEAGYGRYLHGEAVGIGMRMAAELSRRLGLLAEPGLPARQDALLRAFNLPLVHHAAAADELDRLLACCRLDKKASRGAVRFVLPRRPGEIEIIAGPAEAEVRAAFAAGMDETSTGRR